MTTTIEGIYENGQITLNELPKDIKKANVKVVFEGEEIKENTGKRKMGIFKGTITMSDDFDEPLEELKDYM
jgi:ribosomal protein S3AE